MSATYMKIDGLCHLAAVITRQSDKNQSPARAYSYQGCSLEIVMIQYTAVSAAEYKYVAQYI